MTEASQNRTIPGPAYGWYLASGMVAAALICLAAALYPGLPQSLPVHWNGAGNADAYADKSFWPVFSVPLICAGLVLFLLGTAALVPRLAAVSGQLGGTGDPAAQIANLRATQFFLGATTFVLSLLFAWLALRGWLLPPDGSVLEFTLPTLALFPALAGIGAAALRRYRREVAQAAGAPASSASPAGPWTPAPAAAPVDGTDPAADSSHYRAGIYVNRADPRVLVPKRFGAGWSVNAARPAGLAFYLVIALLCLAGLVAGIALPLLAA